jgi:hypothetical protein
VKGRPLRVEEWIDVDLADSAADDSDEEGMYKRFARQDAKWVADHNKGLLDSVNDYILDTAQLLIVRALKPIQKELLELDKRMTAMEERFFDLEVALSRKRERSPDSSGAEEGLFGPPHKRPRRHAAAVPLDKD